MRPACVSAQALVGFIALTAGLVVWADPPLRPTTSTDRPRAAQTLTRTTGVSFRPLRPVARLPASKLAPFYPQAEVPEPVPTESLADAIALAYRSNPTLLARRYDLRATDENLGVALSELRPTSALQITGQYDKTVPGRTTQAARLGSRSPIITSNTLNSQLIITQPITTGGRASADISAAGAEIRAGRAALRATEGDLLLQTITAYVDVRRDTRALSIRQANLAQLQATLDEVKARREAGELTRTDIAQAETQLTSAQAQFNATRDQLEQSRAVYASLVGVEPGGLALEPPLPQVPPSADAAFDQATQLNPELAQARFNEVASRQKIVAARAATLPTLSLRGTVGLTGQATPYYLRNEDQAVSVQGILTVPLTAGGHTGALISQALNTNSGDRLRIEAARRAMVLRIANAWNQMVTARRNVLVEELQVKSARFYYEGSFEEYRAGLRSTFDVLFAQGTLRDSEIALVSARHDLYVAQATLLRHIGLLEVKSLMTGVDLYDVTGDIRHIEHRGATPWDAPVRAYDRNDRASPKTKALEQPKVLPTSVKIAPLVGPPPPDSYVISTPNVPQPGTIGRAVTEAPY